MASEKVTNKMLSLDDDGRTHLMREQIKAFEQKVSLCIGTFSAETFYVMLTDLNKLDRIKKNGNVTSVSRLRKALKALNPGKDNDRFAENGSLSVTPQERLTMYFGWFLEYIDYLKEIKNNFHLRIFVPLHRFFYNTDILDTAVPTLTPSTPIGVIHSPLPPVPPEIVTKNILNYTSNDQSVDTDLPLKNGQDSECSSGRQSVDSIALPMFNARRASQNALMLLSSEFKDIAHLYDNSKLENISERLSYLKERWDVLLEDECEPNTDLFSVDSIDMVGNIDRDAAENVINFVRIVPDVMVKCRKAARLARKWLDIDVVKTKDLHSKLEKIGNIQKGVTDKLSEVDKDIDVQEELLMRKTSELENLLELEERSGTLQSRVFSVEKHVSNVQEEIQTLTSTNKELKEKIVRSKTQNGTELHPLKVSYEKNKLQLFALHRSLAIEEYKLAVLNGDMQLEMEVKPSLIRFTNHVQETCEKLEEDLEKQKSEKQKLESALVPLMDDQNKVHIEIWERESRSGSSAKTVGENLPPEEGLEVRKQFVKAVLSAHEKMKADMKKDGTDDGSTVKGQAVNQQLHI